MKRAGSAAFWKASSGVAGLLVLLAILVAANVIVGTARLRRDFTEEKLYTLSEGTRSILGKLDADVTLKLFSNCDSPEVPVYLKNYATQVEDLLQEYRMAGGGRVSIETYDPKPDSDAEEWAQRYGISGQSMGLMGPAVYFGLVVAVGEQEGVLPALDPRQEGVLEYNITRLIHRVAHPEKPVVGVMSSLPVLGREAPPFGMMPGQPRPQPQPAWIAFQDLKKDFETREVQTTAESIGDDVDALVVIHPKELGEKTLYAIDQFVLRGGRLLLFVDPLCVADLESAQQPQQPFGGGPRTSSDLRRLLSSWGVGYQADKVIADFRAASRIRGAGNRIEESPVWLSLVATNISNADILTTQLDSMMLPFAGALADNTDQDVTFTPLLSAAEGAGLLNAMTAQFGGDAVRREFKRDLSSLHMAARLSGTFRTAFPDGKPADEADDDGEAPGDEEPAEPEEEEPPGLTEGEGTVVVVGDVDMLYDRFCAQEVNFFGFKQHQPLNDNLNFLANAVEQVAGSSDLIGIRSRGRFNRPFDRVLALQQKAAEAWRDREQTLEESLRETQNQLREMQQDKDKTQRFIMSPEQKRAIERFRQEELRIKKELKQVRRNLRRDIETLGVKVKVINIALMPLLVSIAGISFGLYRKRRR